MGLIEPLVERVVELFIGRVAGSKEPTDDQKEASKIFVDLFEAARTPDDDDERLIATRLDHLDTTTGAIDDALKRLGALASDSRNGNLSVTVIAQRIRGIVATRVNAWQPKLQNYQDRRLQGATPAEWEHEWGERDNCLDDLEAMRVELRAYLDTLAWILRSDDLASALPVPASKQSPATTLATPLTPGNKERPKHAMVRWFDPLSVFGHGIATRRAKKCLSRPPGNGDYSPIVHTGSANPATEKDLWVDYVSDMGDAIDPTLAVAWHLTQPTISLPTHGRGELPKPPADLPRGSLLVMGGDQVYSHASAKNYANQLVLPYRLAAEAAGAAGGQSEDKSSDTQARAEPQVVAIPGNHDWLGGIEHFDQIFTADEAVHFAKHWRTPQKKRYWAVKLIGNWWMWGIDTGLHDVIDSAQREFFDAAADDLGAGDNVIICSPVPFWQLKQKRPKKYDELRLDLDEWIARNGANAPVWLAGDSHFFAHYRRVEHADEHHITAGGGGAFLQPTHNLVEQVPSEENAEPEFKLGARWPRPIDSRGKAASLAGLNDSQFRRALILVLGIHAGYGALVNWGNDTLASANGPESVLRGVLLNGWRGWPLLLFVMVGITLSTVSNSTEDGAKSAARKFGTVHGLAHAAIFVLVAGLAHWLLPGSPWSRYVIAPAVGGFVTLAAFVSASRWINREIKANDTLAYSPAHVTGYKHFIRMRFTPAGNLSLYVVGIDPVGDGWYEALTGTSGRHGIRKLTHQFRRKADVKRLTVPPADANGDRPQLHYVWGHDLEVGSAALVRERARNLGLGDNQTVTARAAAAAKLTDAGNLSGAVVKLQANVEADRQIAPRLDALADALLATGDVSGALDLRLELLDLEATAASPTEAAAARLRLIATVSAFDPKTAERRLEQWVNEQAAASTTTTEWRDRLSTMIDNDQHLLNAAGTEPSDQMLAPMLRARWCSGAEDLRTQLETCVTTLGQQHATTRLARRLLATSVSSSERVEALTLLRANGADRLSLQQRRQLANELVKGDVQRVDELRPLVDQAFEISKIDQDFREQFLGRVWADLGKAMFDAGDTEGAIDELEDAFTKTKNQTVLRELDDLRDLAGLGPYDIDAGRANSDQGTALGLAAKLMSDAAAVVTDLAKRPTIDHSSESANAKSRIPAIVGATVAAALTTVAAISGWIQVPGGGESEPTVAMAAPLADEILGEAVLPLGPRTGAATVPPKAVTPTPVSTPTPAINRLPDSDGLNIAVIALATFDDTPAELTRATAFSEAFEKQLAADAPIWDVFGPEKLSDRGIDSDEISALSNPAEAASGYEELDAYLGERNIDILIFGSLKNDPSVVTIDAWFRISASGMKEGGIAGYVELWKTDAGGSTQSPSGVARQALEDTELGSMLTGLVEFREAGGQDSVADLNRARESFREAQVASSPQVDSFSLHDLATVFIGTIELLKSGAVADADRYTILALAQASFDDAAKSENAEIRTRGLLGLTQVNLFRDPCFGGLFSAVDKAEDTFAEAEATFSDPPGIPPGPHEIRFRLDAVESMISYCHWENANAANEPTGKPYASAMRNLTRVIEEYEGREGPEQERVQFNAATISRTRGIMRIEQATTSTAEDPIVIANGPLWNQGIQDLANAYCWGRESTRDSSRTQLQDDFKLTPSCGVDGPTVAPNS